jgi:outer membrane protein assembly factor BamD
LGLIYESKKTAQILGYNYNSGKWYERSYALLNKDYEEQKKDLLKKSKDNEIGLVKKTINKILNK